MADYNYRLVHTKEVIYKIATTLDAKACKIWLIMYGTADDDTGQVDTSLSDLNSKSGMSISTIRKALDELKEFGILEVKHNVGVSTEYRLTLPNEFGEELSSELTPTAKDIKKHTK